MKIKLEDELLIIYLYNTKLDLNEKDNLTKDIKKILIRVVGYHQITLSGIYQVTIYENKYYGYILELFQIKEFEYGDFIDLKIEIKKDQPFYFVAKNYNFLEELACVYYKDGLFFVLIDDQFKMVNKIEYGDIVYKNISLLTNGCVKIDGKNVNWLIFTYRV